MEDIIWNLGQKIPSTIPEILNYYTDSKLMPEDYPMTGSGFDFLVSKKITDILRRLNAKGIDYYTSQIIRPNGIIIKDFFTLDFKLFLDCIDMENSIYTNKKLTRYDNFVFKKLVLKYNEIPDDTIAFRLEKQKLLLVVKEVVKQEFDKAKVTGVNLIPIEEFSEK